MLAHAPEEEKVAVECPAQDQMLILSGETDSHKELHESPSSIEHAILPDKASETGTPKPFANDSSFQRLLETYHKARRSFDDAKPRSRHRTAAARFLRDTSENCLGYLTRKRCESFIEALTESSIEEITMDKAVVRELNDTVAEMIAYVEGCFGGKKRRLDGEDQTDPSSTSMDSQSKSAGPKKKRRPRIQLITKSSEIARTPIGSPHMVRQQAPSPENLRLGRHEVTMPQDRPRDDRSPQYHIHNHRGESHHAMRRREMRADDHFNDAPSRHTYRFNTASHPRFGTRPFERDISDGRYPSYDSRHDYDEDGWFDRGSEYHGMVRGRSPPRGWNTYRPVYDY